MSDVVDFFRSLGAKSEPKIDESIEPPLVAPMSAQDELAASGTIMPQSGNSSVSTPPVAPVQQAATPQSQPGMVPMQTTTQSFALPPKMLAEQAKIESKALAAQDALTAAQIQQNTLIAEQAKATALEMAAQNQRAATQQAYDAEQTAKRVADVEKALQDYNANKTVNPNRHMERMGVGGRILATIGQAFGAFGAAITHSPNYAQQMIERAIDADIRSQEQDIAARGHAVSMANNQVAIFRQKGLDNQASMAAARLNKLQESQAKIDEILASTKNPQILATGAQIKAGLEKSYNDTLMHYGQVSKSTVSANPASAAPRSVEDQLRLRALEVDVPQKDPKTGKALPSKTYIAKSAQDAEKVRDALVVRNAIKTELSELQGIVETKNQSVSPKAKALAQKKYNSIKTKLGVMYKLGALAEADLDLVSQLGDVTSMFQRDSTSVDLIGQLNQSLDTNVESEMRGRGLIQ